MHKPATKTNGPMSRIGSGHVGSDGGRDIIKFRKLKSPPYVGLLFAIIYLSSANKGEVNCLPHEIKVGAIFGPNELQQELVFRSALGELNNNMVLMPKSVFVPKVENVSRDDSFDADRKACNLLKSGVVAILGPLQGAASQHVQAICDSLEVPHIEIKPDLVLRRFDLAINLYPSYDILARAYIDLIQAWNWTSFAVVYDSSEAMIRLQDIFKELSGLYARKWTIKLFQLQSNSSFRDLFWSVKKSGENNIVLDVSRELMFNCLKQAQQVGLMTERQSYLITSLDLSTIDLEDFRYGRTKITGLQMIDRQSKRLEKLLADLNRSVQMIDPGYKYLKNYTSADILVQTALIYDAVNLLASGMHELDSVQSISAQSLTCDDSGETWQYGSSIINYMRSISLEGGLTGRVSFDQSGRRSGVTFDVISLSEFGLEYIGKWREDANVSLDIDEKKFNRFYVTETDTVDTLVVTSIRTQPYFMLKSTPNKQEGNDQYEGYAVDLIHELSRIVGFKYKFKEVTDLKYGVREVKPNGTVTWNGIIGEILSGVADLAIADLTITSSREEAVDFTLPFMNTGISIVFKKPTNKVTTLFSFLSPFSLDVWVYVLCAYSGVSVILYLVGHISPYEWTNPYPCRQEDMAVMKNSFSLLNSFWFTIGSLMQQGSDLAPKSMSTRAMAGTWYFFTLIMISSYTANLAAFLTVEKIVYPIENAKDLSEQTEIKYGCVESGSTRTFFKDSQIETYKKIYQFMETHKTYVRSNDQGKERVEQGNFAFFMESTSIEYITERNCNLTQIGSPLDSKNYGIATRKHPPYKRPYRMLLSQAILQLQENGMLHVLKNRWWKERHGVGTCSDDGKGGGVTELSLANVGGVFVVLLGGMGLAFILALFESFMWMMRRKLGRDPMCEQMMQDLKFALSCQSSSKPNRRRVPMNEFIND
uniref:Glutamate receptor, ionotropic kainate 2 n=1 Tax=Aceria tosichella TaxID=561515 RepID=A0A6G1S9T4_9ACAR